MVKILVKNRLRSVLPAMLGKSMKNKNGSAGKPSVAKIVGFTVLIVYLIACFLFLSASLALSLAETVLKTGASWFYFGVFMLIDLGMIFFFSIFETKSELFECKDNDLLLSMPIKPRDIVASRVLVVVIYNYLEQLLIMLPCIVIYAIYTHDIIGIIGAFAVSLFIPLISTALSSAVGYAIAMISRRIRRKTLVTTLISIVFMVAFFFGYSAMLNNMDSFMEGTGAEITVLPESAPLLYCIGSVALLKPLNLTLFVLASVSISALAYFLISKNYIKITTYTGISKKAVYNGEITKRKSPLFALVGKEIRKFLSSTNYMMNSATGIIFSLVVGVLAVVKRSDILEVIDLLSGELGVNSEFIFPFMICAVIMLSCMNMQSASALSLEGKNLWCLKSMPVSDREVLLSKFVPQVIITVPPTVITSVLFIISTSAPVKYWIFFILTPALANILFALLGLVMNVAFPKLEFDNEVQPIKQSMAVFLTMMSQLVLALVFFGLNAIIAIIGFPIIAAFLTLGILVGLIFLFYFILVGPCVKKYSSIEP